MADLKTLIEQAKKANGKQVKLGQISYMRQVAEKIKKELGVETLKNLGPSGFFKVVLEAMKTEKPQMFQAVRKQLKYSTLRNEAGHVYYQSIETTGW